MSALRLSGCPIEGYIDDFLTKGKTFEHCRNNVLKTVKLFDKIGFVVHPEKSQFTPSQRITFLGFIIDTQQMEISLTPKRIKNLNILICQLLTISNPSRFLSKVIGTIISTFPAVKYGLMHYRG